MEKRGHNEGFRVLDDFVCQAINDPNIPPSPPDKRGRNEGVHMTEDRSLNIDPGRPAKNIVEFSHPENILSEDWMKTDREVQMLPVPSNMPRVETGPIQFGNDWRGLFIRGDNAAVLMLRIRQLAKRLMDYPDADVTEILGQLAEFADMIERDVIV